MAILKMIQNNTFFDLLAKINPDILKESRIELDENDKTNIYLILNELDEDEDEKYNQDEEVDEDMTDDVEEEKDQGDVKGEEGKNACLPGRCCC